MTSLDCKSAGQLSVIGYLNRSFGIHLMWIMRIIEIAKLNGNDRLIEGNPLVYQVSISFKTETRIVFISLDGRLIFPTIAILLKGKRQIKMIEID